MKTLWTKLKRFVGLEKPARLRLRFVPYYPTGEKLCREGWTIAKEEDENRMSGYVYLELLAWPNEEHTP